MQEGWGRGTWGLGAWGTPLYINVPVTGQQTTSAVDRCPLLPERWSSLPACKLVLG